MKLTGDVWRLGHRPALDGLRGVAVLLVVAYHAQAPFLWSAAGPVGVTVFFALSGFLITALLLQENARHGRILLGSFYGRRARRLIPALLTYVAVVTALVAAGARVATPEDIMATLAYVANWLPASGHEMGALNHMWSLAVEEQFYLVWPLVLVAALRAGGERAVLWAALAGTTVSVALRLALWHDGAGVERIYYGTDVRADGLLIGCAVAVLIRRGWRLPRVRGLLPVSVGALVLLGTTIGDFEKFVVLPLAVAMLSALVVAHIATHDIRTVLAGPLLTWLGRRSYALYLWHVLFVQTLATHLDWSWGPALLIGLPLSLVAAELSWRLIERRWLGHARHSSQELVGGDVLRRVAV